MRTQAVYIEDRRTWTDTGPITDRLKVSDAISAIDVIIRGTNGATSNQGNPLHVDVDRVEVIDGSDRIFSLSLRDAIIQHCYEQGRYPHHVLDEGAAAVQEEGFRISFGRYLGDPDYWLDPGMFRNLSYRFTGDLTISATVGFATGTRDITLIAHTMPDHPSGRAGYMMTKELFNFTSVAAGEERVDLPDDFPYRFIGLRALESGIAFEVDITNIKLTKGHDSYVYFDQRAINFRDLLSSWRGEHEITQILFRTDADTPSCLLAYPNSFSVTALNDFDIATIDARTVDQLTIQLLTLAAAPSIAKSSTDRAIVLNARGVMPHFGGLWQMGDPNDPNQWPSGDNIRDLELVLTQGGAGADVRVWAQQVRS